MSLIGGGGSLELIKRIETLEKRIKELEKKSGALTIPIARIANASIKEYLKANLKSGYCIPFMFYGLTDNPFTQLIYGYGMAFYYQELSASAWIIAHNGAGTIETKQISLK